MPTTLFHPFVPSVVRQFRTAYPQVSLTLDECLRTEQIERLRNQQLDIGFLRSALDGHQDLLVYPLLNEAMVVALQSDHPLARSGRHAAPLSLKYLAGEQFIIFARQTGPAFYEATMAACQIGRASCRERV